MTGAEIMIAAQIAQTVSGFVGGMQQAKVANKNAAAATAQAAEEERRFRVQAMQRQGKVTTAAASQGAGLDAMDIMGSNAATEELDALMVRYGGQVKATAYKNEAIAAKNKAFGDLIGAGASLYGSNTGGKGVSAPSTTSYSSSIGPTQQSYGGFYGKY
jgi:hypothetical protein